MDVCVVDSKDLKMNLRFEVADVKKPLIAVKRICEKGELSFVRAKGRG